MCRRRSLLTGLLLSPAAAVGLALLLGANGCPGGAVSPFPGIGGVSDYVAADVCRNCHTEIHQLWSASRHASALETLRAAGQQNNPECLPCHTTAYGEGGFVSLVTTPKFGGVQCEGCHGPGATHVGTRNPADIIRVPLSDTCGRCHTGPMQPNHEEWAASRHATALATVLNDPGRADACLACHSYDYARAVRRNADRALRGLPPLPLPSIDDAATDNDPKEPVGCSSCHAPHGSSNPHQLRAGPYTTCTACHVDPAVAVGTTPHAPQANFFASTGGRQLGPTPDPPSIELTGFVPVHGSINDLGGCSKCHGLRATVPQPSDATPNQTGHRFEIVFENCAPCHTPAASIQVLAAAHQAQFAAQIAALRAKAAQLRLKPGLSAFDLHRIDAAVLNCDLIDADRSGGIHNVPYTIQLLTAADALLNSIP